MIKNINGNIKLIISHMADIDGMGSVILAKKFFDNKIDYILGEIPDIKDILLEYGNDYETIYICDLSLLDDTIKTIIDSDLVNKIKHFDHHISRLKADNPSFVNVVDQIDGFKVCGTWLFYQYLVSLNSNFKNDFYDTLVEGIRANDTWDKNGDFDLGRKLASIHAMLGPVPFIDLICGFDENKDFIMPQVFIDLVNADDNKMHNYICNANDTLYKTNYKDYVMGVVLKEQYRSMLGNDICTMNPDIDFCFIVNFERNSVSLRTAKDDIDLSVICHEFHPDGGGHKKASGFVLDHNSIPKVMPYVEAYLKHLAEVK